MKKTLPSLALALLLALTTPLLAQTSDEPRPSELVEEVSVRLVQLTIFATDEEGRPVLDLRPEELRVKDGKEGGGGFPRPERV